MDVCKLHHYLCYIWSNYDTRFCLWAIIMAVWANHCNLQAEPSELTWENTDLNVLVYFSFRNTSVNIQCPAWSWLEPCVNQMMWNWQGIWDLDMAWCRKLHGKSGLRLSIINVQQCDSENTMKTDISNIYHPVPWLPGQYTPGQQTQPHARGMRTGHLQGAWTSQLRITSTMHSFYDAGQIHCKLISDIWGPW